MGLIRNAFNSAMAFDFYYLFLRVSGVGSSSIEAVMGQFRRYER